MANTSAVYARIDTELKESAEHILAKLGISPSSAIQMLYSQIVLTQGLPFDLRLPNTKSESAKSGRTYSAKVIDSILSKESDK